MSGEILRLIDQFVKKEFDAHRRVLSFEEYLQYVTKHPQQQTRGSAQYMIDMFDYFQKKSVPEGIITESNKPLKKTERFTHYHFGLFDFPVDGTAEKVIGHEDVQTQIYKTLQSFAKQKINNRLILLHGPNGSAKSTITHSIMGGIERYSKQPEGASYTFNWVFPHEKLTKGGIGISGRGSHSHTIDSYAKLPDTEVAARIPCDLKDHPLLLIASEHRKSVLEKILGAKEAEKIWESLPIYLSQGDLCQRCYQIYEALLAAHDGDYKEVLKHVQVERIYFSRKYRKGLVTIEPQLHVDATYNQLTLDKRIASLPPSLQNLNFFTLHGDLIEGNRGIIEFSDLLKPPIDTLKYLLIACETNSVNVGSAIAHLDSVMIGSSNELQLDAFKEFPDFSSFKARIELIRVSHLLKTDEEAQIYSMLLPHVSSEKHIAPHVSWTLALWGVLTRLKKPNSINYPPNVSSIISNLSPVEKARLYNNGTMPVHLSPEERKLLKANVHKLKDEYTHIPYYEGRMGASVRELKTIIFNTIQNPEFACVSPLAVLKEVESFVKHVSDYEFLKQDVKDGFHDVGEFINIVRNEYLERLDREVRECMGLYENQQWEQFIKRYVMHVSHLLKKEKIQNAVTGKYDEPDRALMEEFEKIVEAPSDPSELESFRKNMISVVGAWSLDHSKQTLVYKEVFPQYWQKLEKHYFESQKATLTKMQNALQVYGTEEFDANSEGSQLAKKTINNMISKFGYCEQCANAAISFLLQKKY